MPRMKNATLPSESSGHEKISVPLSFGSEFQEQPEDDNVQQGMQ